MNAVRSHPRQPHDLPTVRSNTIALPVASERDGSDPRQELGHLDLGVTSIYLQGIDAGEIIETIHARRPPMIPASAGLDLRH